MLTFNSNIMGIAESHLISFNFNEKVVVFELYLNKNNRIIFTQRIVFYTKLRTIFDLKIVETKEMR